MILSELLYKLVLFCDIVRVGKNSYCEFDKFEFGGYRNVSYSLYFNYNVFIANYLLSAGEQETKTCRS